MNELSADQLGQQLGQALNLAMMLAVIGGILSVRVFDALVDIYWTWRAFRRRAAMRRRQLSNQLRELSEMDS